MSVTEFGKFAGFIAKVGATYFFSSSSVIRLRIMKA